ncbi:MAG: hypothetical protein IK145_01020 [Bacteroidales bacterium]|jgi:hypothetical protein|nr:hypothetical protein [Bacteroidales bacterium]MBR5396419.1 hypothetical protein [Bacteroidales bacterium]
MKGLILKILPLLMLAVSCSVKMDPYKGGTGVRANINGCKAVMYGEPTKKYAAYTIDPVYESYSFSTVRLPLTSNEIGKECQLEITVSTRSALIPGRPYRVGNGEGTAHLYLNDATHRILLSGEVTFLKEGPVNGVTEARFELSGKDVNHNVFEVRHGFLRLHTTKYEIQQ